MLTYPKTYDIIGTGGEIMAKKLELVTGVYKHRIKHNKTQSEMAALLGVSLSTYSALERGKGKPSRKTLTKIALLLDRETEGGM